MTVSWCGGEVERLVKDGQEGLAGSRQPVEEGKEEGKGRAQGVEEGGGVSWQGAEGVHCCAGGRPLDGGLQDTEDPSSKLPLTGRSCDKCQEDER